ncbi:hypothetical protein ACFV2D_34655 [Streptomyces capillispiralis]|uniref:hypothetical protein n=1 Tax=Streptomyces capillispiralis TaxID=68182 RepID=UPI0036B4E869
MNHVVLLALMASALGVVGCGVAGLATGWIHPWERGRVLRPVAHGLSHILWGSGFFCICVVFLMASVGGTLLGGISLKMLLVGIVLFLIGTVLRGVATFPDR